MRLRWVGDSRDYVKWDCVFKNAEGRFVFYVPMLRRDIDSVCEHKEVQQHFDQRKNLEQFGELFPGRFAVFDLADKEYSKETADRYFGSVITQLQSLQGDHKVLVFIDPDTGIEPRSGAKDEHLRGKDLGLVWAAMQSGDKLVVYQHASRVMNWQLDLRKRATEILGAEAVNDHYYNGKIAKDVCFLVLEKSE